MSPATKEAKGKRAGMRLGTVLVPTDFSEESLEALQYGRSLLEKFEGSLHLVHVQEPSYVYTVPSLLEPAPLFSTGEVARLQTAQLKKLCARFAGGGDAPPCHVLIGVAYDEICNFAREIKADVIVIATRGATGAKRLFLGSTAERVIRHAPCLVLAVRRSEQGHNRDGVNIRRILAPVDFSVCSKAGVERAVYFARATGATVVLVHAVNVLPLSSPDRLADYGHMPSPGKVERAARAALRRFEQALAFDGVPHEAAVCCGRPANAICDFATETKADLIVTSTHGHTGLRHAFIGSVAEHVVRYAPCPVLVVPSRESAHRSRENGKT